MPPQRPADDRPLLVAKQAVLAGVRIQRAHGNARFGDAQPTHHAVGQAAFGHDRLGRQIGEHAAQRLVQRDVHDAESMRTGAGQGSGEST